MNVDSEGYYTARIGEIIQHRYRVTSVAGKGVFSCVVKADKLVASNKGKSSSFVPTNLLTNQSLC